MELKDFNSDLRKVNKLLENIKKEYNVSLTDTNVNDIVNIHKRKLDWMIENVQDTISNPAYAKSKMIHSTATMAQRLLEFTQYRIDPKTGVLLHYIEPRIGGDTSVSARPDLYWREQEADTADTTVIPMPLDPDEIADASKQFGHTLAGPQEPGGLGIYVGVDTPGAQATVVNHKAGANKVVTPTLSKTGVIKPKTSSQKSKLKPTGADDTAQSVFTNIRGRPADKYTTQVKSPIAGSKDQQRMNENMKKGNHILMLAESEIEKAQIVMAVHNEIVEKMQRDAEKMSNMKVDVLGPIVERIKAEHGLAPAEHFRDTITRLLDQALDVVMQVKDQINTETLKLTGDISSAPSLQQDLTADAGLGSLDDASAMAGSDFSFDDGMSVDEPELEPMPAAREVKEAARLGVVLESKTGKMGKKFFNSPSEMRTWLSENKNKIAKVHKLLKD